MYSGLGRLSCNLFVEDPLEDSEIFHSGEGGDIERWLEPRNKSFVFAIVCLTFYCFLHFILV